jgi:MinD-like ATPase involved in chromosome partitioning or flagellar assembly
MRPKREVVRMYNNQILAVWGSPSCGKTITSVKLARELSLNKKNVVLVLCDNLCPSLPVLLPMNDTAGKSLGVLLAGSEITQDKILTSCITLKRNEYISILGYGKGENCYTHAAYSREKAVDLLVLLRHLADYVIIDCSSNIASDVLSAVALETADRVLRLGSCDLKGVSFLSSQLPLLSDKRFNADRHIKAISNTKHYEPKNEIRQCYKGVRFEIPHTAELTEQYLSGELFDGLKSGEGKAFEKIINDIVKEVFGI